MLKLKNHSIHLVFILVLLITNCLAINALKYCTPVSTNNLKCYTSNIFQLLLT